MSNQDSRPEKSLPPGADGDDSLFLDNDSYDIKVGETESGTWIWNYQGRATLYHEYFALQAAGVDPIASYESATIKEEFTDDGELETNHSAVVEMTVDGVPLRIKRTVRMPDDRPTFVMKYDVSNVGDAALEDFQLIQYADFDDGSSGFWDDVGEYDTASDVVYVRDEAGTAFAGFSGNRQESNHHVGAYPGYDEVANDALNNADRYPSGSGSGDAVVAKEWSFRTLDPSESVSVTLQFGAASTFDSLKEDVESPDPVSTTPPGRQRTSGSATTITLLPGGSEDTDDGADDRCEDHNDDCEDGGDKLDSSMPDYWGSGLDAWFLADKREAYPDDVSREEVLGRTKTFPEYGDEEFVAHRLKNHLTISFPTQNGTSIAGWDGVEIETRRENPPYVALEGEDNAIRRISDDPPSDAWGWFEGREKARARTEVFDYVVESTGDGQKPRSEEINKVTVGDVEGVRASVILGGTDTFIDELNAVYNELGAIDFVQQFPGQLDDVPSYVVAPPTFYTFLDLIVMADQTLVTRVWDTSPYPKHYLYLQGSQVTDNGFERGTGKALEPGKANNGVWIRNQDLNRERFTPMVKQTHLSLIEPFSPHEPKAYEKKYDHDPLHLSAPQDHPVITEGIDGEALSANEVMEKYDTPLFPWEGKH